jgi:hypothetical protein
MKKKQKKKTFAMRKKKDIGSLKIGTEESKKYHHRKKCFCRIMHKLNKNCSRFNDNCLEKERKDIRTCTTSEAGRVVPEANMS